MGETLCPFFYRLLWGQAKEEVYKRKPKTLQGLELEKRDVLGNVRIDFLCKSVDNV